MIKVWIGVIGYCLMAVGASSQGRVVAKLSNLRNEKGVCRVCIFNSPAAFKGEAGIPVGCNTVSAKGEPQVVFEGLPAGTYAVFAFHDVNNNNRMDKNFLGIPKEGYGASRNNLPFAAAPTFEGNKFMVANKSTVTVNIRLRNL
ncbi:MAG: hypothetical protein JWP69_1459 [Flaviaesturariibacter sp.]|nr:hypothetical protein [Flaviaesturariibacter sp.]